MRMGMASQADMEKSWQRDYRAQQRALSSVQSTAHAGQGQGQPHPVVTYDDPLDNHDFQTQRFAEPQRQPQQPQRPAPQQQPLPPSPQKIYDPSIAQNPLTGVSHGASQLDQRERQQLTIKSKTIDFSLHG